MNNDITEWSYDKPTEPGLYLSCRGDVETHPNIEAFMLVDKGQNYSNYTWKEYTVNEVASWLDGFKFARLCVGSECAE